jgi:hypothetical protein
MSSLISRTVRNITNAPTKINLPTGAKTIRLQYSDSGTAGLLRIVRNAVSANDAAHRLTHPQAHLVIPSGARLPLISLAGVTAIYVQTDNAIGAGSNTLTLDMETE